MLHLTIGMTSAALFLASIIRVICLNTHNKVVGALLTVLMSFITGFIIFVITYGTPVMFLMLPILLFLKWVSEATFANHFESSPTTHRQKN